MQLMLLIVLFVGSSYFVFARRRLDAFSVAFFSAAIYFLPGFVGYTLTPVTPENPIKLPTPLELEAIAIMLAVLASIVLGGFVWDLFDLRSSAPRFRLQSSGTVAYVAVIIGLAGFLWAIIEDGPALFAPNKRIVIEVVGRGHLLWQMGAALSVPLAWGRRQWAPLLLGTALLLIDMWIGFRYAFATAFIGVVWLSLIHAAPCRLVQAPKRYLVVAIVGGLAILSYQNLKEPLRAGNWSEAGRRVSSPVWYVAGVMTSEPFTTQTVLNEIVRRDFRTDTDHLWSAALHLIVFSPNLGAEAQRFNSLYQPALFPDVDHGMADNIWGQMWSATGWTGLMVFLVFYNGLLAIGSRVLRIDDPTIRGGAVLLGAYWCFYIHRNELLVQIGYMKQFLVVWLTCIVVARLLDAAAAVPPEMVARRQEQE